MLYFGGGEGEDVITKHKLGWIANEGDYSHLNKILASITSEELNYALSVSIQETARLQFDFKKQLMALKNVI